MNRSRKKQGRAGKLLLVFFLPLLLAAMFTGCGESYTLSRQVDELWENFPSPWTQESARAAATEARKLMTKHPRDFQLARYYVDRMEFVDPGALGIEMAAMLRERPDDPRMIVLDAMVNKDFVEYMHQVEHAREMAPDDPYVLTEYVRALLRQQPPEIDAAVTIAFDAADIAPDLSLTNGRLAYALMMSGDPDKGIEYARKAVELNGHDYFYTEILSRILEMQDRHEESIAVVEEFNRRHPADPYAVARLLEYYRDRGNYPRMIDVKRAAAHGSPNGGTPYIELAMLFRVTGQLDSTFFYLNRAVGEGFFDENLFHFAFESDMDSLRDDPRFAMVLDSMRERKVATRNARRDEALANPLALPAPELRAVNLKGSPVSLGDLRGKVVVLDFWSTWSGWCQVDQPLLASFYRDAVLENRNDVELIGVNVWEQSTGQDRLDSLREYVTEEGITWQVWVAADEIPASYGVQGLPTYVVIDRTGVIRYQVVGYTAFIDEVLAWMVEDAREGQFADVETDVSLD